MDDGVHVACNRMKQIKCVVVGDGEKITHPSWHSLPRTLGSKGSTTPRTDAGQTLTRARTHARDSTFAQMDDADASNYIGHTRM